MADDAVMTVVMQILAAYALGLLIFGTISSVLNILVCLRRRLRRVNTFVVLIFISAADIFTLYVKPLHLIAKKVMTPNTNRFFSFLMAY